MSPHLSCAVALKRTPSWLILPSPLQINTNSFAVLIHLNLKRLALKRCFAWQSRIIALETSNRRHSAPQFVSEERRAQHRPDFEQPQSNAIQRLHAAAAPITQANALLAC
jgi:hypothetical protein